MTTTNLPQLLVLGKRAREEEIDGAEQAAPAGSQPPRPAGALQQQRGAAPEPTEQLPPGNKAALIQALGVKHPSKAARSITRRSQAELQVGPHSEGGHCSCGAAAHSAGRPRERAMCFNVLQLRAAALPCPSTDPVRGGI